MSAGQFITLGYASDRLGTIHPIRIQPETATAVINGTVNAGAVGDRIGPSAQVSRSKRAIGINARTVTIQFAEGAAPAGYKEGSSITIPVLQNSAAFLSAKRGDPVTYLSSSATIVGVSAETVN